MRKSTKHVGVAECAWNMTRRCVARIQVRSSFHLECSWCLLGQKNHFNKTTVVCRIFLRPRWCRLSQSRRPPTPLLIGGPWRTDHGGTTWARTCLGKHQLTIRQWLTFKLLGITYGSFLKWYPKMDGLEWKTLFRWVIWGYHHLRKPPYWYRKKNRLKLSRFKTPVTWKAQTVHDATYVSVHVWTRVPDVLASVRAHG